MVELHHVDSCGTCKEESDDLRSFESESTESFLSSDDVPKVVLVTGGAGFIGSHTAMNLLDRGDSVVVVDEVNDYYDVKQKQVNLKLLKEKASKVHGFFEFYQANICDRNEMDEILTKHEVTHVCHLAARAGVRPSIEDPYIYVQSNVMGTITLMELSAQHNIVNFVYASSSSVYGGSQLEKFSEDDPVNKPVSQYAATKKACELFAATYNNLYGLNCTGLRFFTVYGERGRPDMAPYKFIHRILNGITIDQYGDGSSERDYTYIDDIVDGVILAIDKPLGNEVINLGRGSPVNLKTFIQTVEELCDRKADINVMSMQPGDVPRTCCDTSKAFNLLGYEPKISLREGLKNTVDWYTEWSSTNIV